MVTKSNLGSKSQSRRQIVTGCTAILQRRSAPGAGPLAVPHIVHNVLQSPGKPLEPATRTFMESRFGHDFSRVRVHTDARAAESARAVDATAYAVGPNIVFGSGRYSPRSEAGRVLLAHELAHVIQQGTETKVRTQSEPRVVSMGDGSYRIAASPPVIGISDNLENRTDAIVSQLFGEKRALTSGRTSRVANSLKRTGAALHRRRIPLPRPAPLCGGNLTHIDVLPPRWRPLRPCLPAHVPVYRVNVVGREVSSATTGKGRQIFNLHVGYYRDPGTGRLCVIADDSKRCVIGRCVGLGCFPTLREVLDAIWKFIKNVLKVVGIMILLIILVIITRGLMRSGPMPGPAPVPIAGGRDGAITGEGETVEA